jgi:hypothetical protein
VEDYFEAYENQIVETFIFVLFLVSRKKGQT